MFAALVFFQWSAPAVAQSAKSDAAPIVQELTAEAAAPYLGLYWGESLPRPMIVVLYKDRLAIELPGRALRELRKTTEQHVWSDVENPENLVKFHREGNGPATAVELRQDKTTTLPRFEPEKGLPSLAELFARRPDPQHAKQLGALGTMRMSGSIALTMTPEKKAPLVSFELLAAGDDHSRLTLKLKGEEVSQQVVAGKRAWLRTKSSPVQEMPEAKARAGRLAGWLLASGDWRDEFKQARVLKRIELDGKPVFIVHAAPEKGWQRLIYLDAKNGLTLGYDELQEHPAGLVGYEVRFADYREIEGVQIPFRRTGKYSEKKLSTRTFQVEKIETHLKLDNDPFTIK
jgi:hypothetical protein